MIQYALKRLTNLIPVCFCVVTIVSLMIHIVPGDPVDLILGDFASPDEKELLREQLGLNLPLITQLQQYFWSLSQGDLGTSLVYQEPVWTLISQRFAPTAELACLALLVAMLLSIPTGIYCAVNHGKASDHLAMTASLMGAAIPNFWLGPMLILIFSIHLELLPVSERSGFDSYILPAITLGTALAGILSRITRNAMVEVIGEEYIRTAKAKGAKRVYVIWKHALKNAALPVITILGLQFGVLLTGAVVTETIFDWPGLGSLILEALNQRDYPLVQGCVLVFSMTYLFVNLVTDLLYALTDPRIKLESHV